MKLMRKLLLILLTGISINAVGQIHLIGIQGGVNLTNLTGNNIFGDSKYRTGIIGGLNYEFLFQSKYTFGADILYSQQGFKDNVTFSDEYGNIFGTDSESKFYYNYLTLPIKFGYTTGSKLKGFVKVGACPSVLLKAETTVPTVDSSGNLTGYQDVDVKDKVSKFDLGGLIELGAGYVLINNMELFSSLTYRKSLTTFSNSEYFSDNKLRHYGFSLAIGLKFRLNDK